MPQQGCKPAFGVLRIFSKAWNKCIPAALEAADWHACLSEQNLDPIWVVSVGIKQLLSFSDPSLSPLLQFDPRSQGVGGWVSRCELGGLHLRGYTWNSCIQVRVKLQSLLCGVKPHPIQSTVPYIVIVDVKLIDIQYTGCLWEAPSP